jgi:hypothetical protein
MRARSPTPRARSPPPAPRAGAPPPAQQQRSGLGSGLVGMVAQGMMFGTGSAMAHRAVDAVLGPRGGPAPPQEEAAAAAAAIVHDELPCNRQAKLFADCLVDGDMDVCEPYFSKMRECRLAMQ